MGPPSYLHCGLTKTVGFWILAYCIEIEGRLKIPSGHPSVCQSWWSNEKDCAEYVRTGEGSDFWHVQYESGFSYPYCSQTIGYRGYWWLPNEKYGSHLSTDMDPMVSCRSSGLATTGTSQSQAVFQKVQKC